MGFFKYKPDGSAYIEVALSDYALVANPLLNKGLAFNNQERKDFKLYGLLPPHQETLEDQVVRSYQAFKEEPTDLDKYIFLRSLQDTNETLFYSLALAYIPEIMPIVYTPTVGLGCQRFSHLYRRPRGLFISYPDKDHIDEILSNSRFDKVKAIVVSDGERILGLGDQGAGGMGIPIGKLSLYSACAGIHPAYTLPILLDTGTNNKERMNDPLYIGWRHERVRGKEYDDFIDHFVSAVKRRFPHVLLQWEDFAQQNASPILEKYRDQLCTFNDDIQGTAAVAFGTLLSAVQVTGKRLRDQVVAVAGAGSAGVGISKLILQAMIEDGLSEAEAKSRFFLVDRYGLLQDGMSGLLDFQKYFLQSKNTLQNWQAADPNHITLEEVVKNAHPSLLIGVSGQPGIFTETIVREMAKHTERPVIFPLSNPTDRSEAIPEDIYKWTNGKALVGTGSPFPNLVKNGRSFRIDQTNNSYIFPGMGLGIISVKAKRVTDAMFLAAGRALADCSPAKKDPESNLLPPLTQIREVSFQVALAVAKEAVKAGLAEEHEYPDLVKTIRENIWEPAYVPYVKIEKIKKEGQQEIGV